MSAQRRELVTGGSTSGATAVFVDQAPVRAALYGRVLILDGLEKVNSSCAAAAMRPSRHRAVPVSAHSGVPASAHSGERGGSHAPACCCWPLPHVVAVARTQCCRCSPCDRSLLIGGAQRASHTEQPVGEPGDGAGGRPAADWCACVRRASGCRQHRGGAATAVSSSPVAPAGMRCGAARWGVGFPPIF